jgi:predicted transcriptional regulator
MADLHLLLFATLRNMSNRVHVTLPPDLARRVEQLASLEMVSSSAIVRRATARHIAEEALKLKVLDAAMRRGGK